MSAKYFLDTNIFVYGFDDRQPEKKARSLALIASALKTGDGLISWQVMQEFLNVSMRKFQTPLNPADARTYLQKILFPLCRIFPGLDLYDRAIDLTEKTGYSFYDSLILAGALNAGCEILYTEDLRAGHRVDSLLVVNPFA